MSQQPNIVTTTQVGPRGIPEALFIDNVEDYLGGPDAEIEPALQAWQQMIGYKVPIYGKEYVTETAGI